MLIGRKSFCTTRLTMTNQTIELAFSAKNKVPPLPYACLAAAKMARIEVALNPAAEDPVMRLSVAATPSAQKSTIVGESSILRFLARSSNKAALYPEQNPTVAYRIDEWLSLVQDAVDNNTTPRDLTTLAEKVDKLLMQNSAKKTSIVGVDELTIADLSVWSLFKGHDKVRTPVPTLEPFTHFYQWFKSVEDMSLIQEAVGQVDAAFSLDASSNAANPAAEAFERKVRIVATHSVLDMFRKEIAQQLEKLCGHPADQIEGYLEIPRGQQQSDKGDFQLPVPRMKVKGNPVEVAQDLAAKFPLPSDLIESVTAAGPFMTFKIHKTALRDSLIPFVHANNVKYGMNESGKGKSVVVEFSSPNIAKPFHAGHLRSTIIGNLIRNVCKANGYHTTAINYLGDWGKQYGLLAVGFEKYGSERELLENPIKHLFEVYVKISAEKEQDPKVDAEAFAYFKRMEDGDEQALALWSRFRQLSIEKYKEIYSRLNVTFDVYSGESLFSEKMREVLPDLKRRHVLTESATLHKGVLAKAFELYGSDAELAKNAVLHTLDIYCKFLKSETDTAKAEADLLVKQLAEDKEMTDRLLGRFEKVSGLELGKPTDSLARFNIAPAAKQANPGIVPHLDYLKSKHQLEYIADLDKYKLGRARVQRADGATLYITRDIAAAIDRKEKYNFDKMYYVVGIAQDLHFQQFFKILDVAGFEWSRDLVHVGFGMVKGMSTRKGNVVFLEDMINEAQVKMHEVMQSNAAKYAQIQNPEQVADIVGISAVIVQDMAARRIKDYEFDWRRIMSFEGDTGPFLQYSHSRLSSIERKYLEACGLEKQEGQDVPPFPFRPEVMHHIKEQSALDLLFMLAQYPDLVASLPARQYESSVLLTYMMSVCHKMSSCIEGIYVMGQERDVAEARFWMYWCARVTLGNSIRLLGLTPLDRM